ncbi:MAG: hypothetical protein KF817_11225 [Phycisphaeraceae bacterium]|nr:hypothetical protein [Phycisphaeraceae bacterium]
MIRMSTEMRHRLGAAVTGIGIVLLGGLAAAWPAYRESVLIRREIRSLSHRVGISAVIADDERRLSLELAEKRRLIARSCRTVPPTADTADIVGRLALPVDGVLVLDQNFTTGAATRATGEEGWPEQAIPLTVELRGSFDSGFALLRSIERMDRLLRVTSVRATADRAIDGPGSPPVHFSIGFDVIYADAGGSDRP